MVEPLEVVVVGLVAAEGQLWLEGNLEIVYLHGASIVSLELFNKVIFNIVEAGF